MSDDVVAASALLQERMMLLTKHRGEVVSNLDPKQRGRLQVRVPGVLGDREVWAWPCVPYAGASKGFFFLPDRGTQVWVEFEAGDPDKPVWTGCLWNDGDLPRSDAVPTVKFLKTDKFTLRIDDATGEVVVENQSGAQIVLGALGVKVKGAQVTVQTSSGREVALGADGVNVNKGALKVL